MLANLAYLLGAVVVAAIAGVIIWLRHRQPRSLDANIATFRKGLAALAPEDEAGYQPLRSPSPGVRPVVGHTVRPLPGPGAVRLDAARADGGTNGRSEGFEGAHAPRDGEPG